MVAQQSPGRWMLVAATTLAVTVVAGGLFLLANLSQRESYFEARNFRALHEVAKQLDANLEHPFGVVGANYARQQRLRTTAFYRDAIFEQQDPDDCPSEPTDATESNDESKELTTRCVARSEDKRLTSGAADQLTVEDGRAFRWCKERDQGPVACIEIEFRNLVDPSLALRHFQSIAISHGDGRVIFQSGGRAAGQAVHKASDFLKFSRLELVGQEVGEARRTLPDVSGPGSEETPLLNFAGSAVVPVTVGGADFLVFAIPYRPPRTPTGDKNGDEWKEWVISGVVDAHTFKRAHWEIRRGYAGLFLVLLLLGLFAWPFIKLRFRGPAEGFRVGTLYFLLLSGLLGGTLMIESVVVAHLYYKTESGFDKAARDLAEDMRNRLGNEIQTGVQIHRLQAAAETAGESLSFEDLGNFGTRLRQFLNVSGPSESGNDPETTADYAGTGTIPVSGNDGRQLVPVSTFFLDRAGHLCSPWLYTVTEQNVPAGLDLSKRAYYRKIVHGGSWRPGGATEGALEDALLSEDPFVDSIRSVTTNELESVVSFPASPERTCIIGRDPPEDADGNPVYSEEEIAVFGMLMYFSSVEKAVLPHGFRYAVVNRNSGKVLYHSDDDRRDRENFFVAAEDRGDLHARFEAGVPGRVSFFYDGAENAGYIAPLDETVPLSVVVFYNKGLIDLFTIQTGAMAYALLAVFALWTAFLAVVWQGIARLSGFRAWDFIWPRALPRNPLPTAGAIVVLLLAALFGLGRDGGASLGGWTWIFVFFVLPPLLLVILFFWGRRESRRVDANVSTFVESPPVRYWLRAVLLLLIFLVLPSILVIGDVRDFQAYRYQRHIALELDSATTQRKRDLFAMTDALCFDPKGELDPSICASERQADLGERTKEREHLVEQIHDLGVYASAVREDAGACEHWDGSLWQAQAGFFPALEQLERLIRVETSKPDGRLRCKDGSDTDGPDTDGADTDGSDTDGSDTDGPAVYSGIYGGGPLKTGDAVTLTALGLLALVLIGYFTRVVGNRLFGIRLAGPPQHMPPLPASPDAARHMLIRVPRSAAGESAGGQKTADEIIDDILSAHGIEMPDDAADSIVDLSQPTDVLRDKRDHLVERAAERPFCRIQGFEPPIEDDERRLLLLEIIEELCRIPRIVLILEVSVSPLFKLLQPGAYPRRPDAEKADPSADEIYRWSRVFADFEKTYGRPPDQPYAEIGVRESIETFIERECGAFPGLEKIRESVVDWTRSAGSEARNRNVVARVVKDLARGDYRRLWEECTMAERVLLHGMATADCAHPTHPATEHLMRRGLVRFDPALRIANQSFAMFVRGAEDPRRIKAWRKQVASSAWFYVRVPMLVALGIVGFFVLSYFSDVANVVVAGVPSTIAAITVLSRLFSRTAGGGS